MVPQDHIKFRENSKSVLRLLLKPDIGGLKNDLVVGRRPEYRCARDPRPGTVDLQNQ